MPLVVGIDEAGYGPTLGPLVVAATIWDVQPEHVDGDFWELLGDCVVRAARRGQWRLAVNDSKRVFNRDKGIGTLERSVIAFAAAAGACVPTLSDFLEWVGASPNLDSGLPWYQETNVPIPLDPKQTGSPAVAQRLHGAMEKCGVRCLALRAQVISEDRFNSRVSHTHNKAAVLIEHVLRLIHYAGGQAGERDLVVRVDRLGGRSDYRKLLADAFPDRGMHVEEVSEERSCYRLAAAVNDWRIEFTVGADQHHLPVALASMVAKYVREALMQRFNGWWRVAAPEIAPTAGYYTDAQRFLAEIEPVLPRTGLKREQFVRLR